MVQAAQSLLVDYDDRRELFNGFYRVGMPYFQLALLEDSSPHVYRTQYYMTLRRG